MEAFHPRPAEPVGDLTAPGSFSPTAAAPRRTAPLPAAAPVLAIEPPAPTGVVGLVLAAAMDGVTHVVRPEAAAAVAEEFTFPIVLTLAVLAFLAVQGYVDRRDPKLRLAPQHVVETVVQFQPEAEL